MVAFEVYSKHEKIIDLVLNGRNFHLKLQEILLGKSKYGGYYITANRDIDIWKVNVLAIDIDIDEVNRFMFELHHKNGRPHNHSYVRPDTLEEHYQKLSVEQNLDFFLNLGDYYGVSKLKEIIYLYLRRNVSAKWLSKYFKIDIGEINFLLKYLPCYYNYLEEGEEDNGKITFSNFQ